MRYSRILFFIISGITFTTLIISSYRQGVTDREIRKQCMNPYINPDKKCNKILTLEEQNDLRWNRVLILLDEIRTKQCP